MVLSLRNMLWVMAALAMVTLPHVERLPWWITALTVLLGSWRMYLAYARFNLPAKWLLLLIVAFSTIGIYVHYRTIFGRDAGVGLLIIMLVLKLLETRTQRDGMLLIFLGYFLVITNFLYSQTIPTALYMLCCVWIITAAMVGLHFREAPDGFRYQLKLSARVLAQSAPLMLIFFLLFPRVQGPLWGMPTDAHAGVSGLSDSMAPGSMSNLILSDDVAFRVTFDAPRLPGPHQLYWRGPVMWDFDGRAWTAPRFFYGEPRYETTSQPVQYTVTLEPHNKRWLFALDLPGKVPPRANASSDFQILSERPVSNRLRYDMVSFLSVKYGADESSLALRRALQIPQGYNPRAVALARTLRNRTSDDRQLMNEVLVMFGRDGFTYTLSPPLLGTHTVDEFLFQARSGFCEHYSSAFAFLMRAAGIPARIVTGYLGGELNPVGNYMIVRQADAHAWTEVWFRDTGWVRVDPTAAVSPARVERGIGAALPRTDALPLLFRGDYAFLRQLQLSWDSLANSWNQWVLGYSPERQRRLLTAMGIEDADWRILITTMVIATGLVTLALALVAVFRMRKRIHDPVHGDYLRFCGKLAVRGLPRDAGEGPLAYARRLAQARPDLDASVDAITQLYVALRYGRSRDDRELSQFREYVRQFKA